MGEQEAVALQQLTALHCKLDSVYAQTEKFLAARETAFAQQRNAVDSSLRWTVSGAGPVLSKKCSTAASTTAAAAVTGENGSGDDSGSEEDTESHTTNTEESEVPESDIAKRRRCISAAGGARRRGRACCAKCPDCVGGSSESDSDGESAANCKSSACSGCGRETASILCGEDEETYTESDLSSSPGTPAWGRPEHAQPCGEFSRSHRGGARNGAGPSRTPGDSARRRCCDACSGRRPPETRPRNLTRKEAAQLRMRCDPVRMHHFYAAHWKRMGAAGTAKQNAVH